MERTIFFHTDRTVKNKQFLAVKKAGIFIGPEGGWSENEVVEAKAKGFVFKSLSPLILRAETAAILAVHTVVMSDSC